METATIATANAQLLTVSAAARMLGVHSNTVRNWTEQGLLTCLRVSSRGDRRYARQEIVRFLARTDVAGAAPPDSSAGHARVANGHPNGKPMGHSGQGATRPSENADIALLSRSAGLAVSAADPRSAVESVAGLLCDERGYAGAALVARDGSVHTVSGSIKADERLAVRAASRRAVLTTTPRRRDGTYQAALPFGDDDQAGGVVLLAGTAATRSHDEPLLLAAIAAQMDVAVALSGQLERLNRRQDRAELLLSIGDGLNAHHDPTWVLGQLVENAVQAFGAQHAGVFLISDEGGFETAATHNLSVEFCQVLEHAAHRPLIAAALSQRQVVTATDYPGDPRSFELRTAIRREGFNSVAVAPLISGDVVFGALCLYHDERHEWSAADIALLERLARHGAAVMRSAQDYSQMAKWTAQLQSIQHVGARLTGLRSVDDIGQAICAELVQLIDTHNTRVYRVIGETCEPVAWRGQIGEYDSEDGEQLRLKVGEGITGWVARFGLAQNVGDAARDKRAHTIPGTDADLDESLLLAPMLYEDNVLGVIVLAKLGLNQFKADDLRLLEIYAAIAAQAMASADVTERLHAQSETLARQLSSQRELLRLTEAILATLDTQALLEQIADSLNSLMRVDNMAVVIHDEATRRLRPIFARGTHAAEYLADVLPDDLGEGAHVIRTGEPLLIQDELADPRVAHFDSTGPLAGSLIVAPLRAGDGTKGVLTIERLGSEARFSDEEFDLVKLFAAHVSIALSNAAAHRAVEIRAETDLLTGLLNHGALTEQIAGLVAQRTRFGMLMVDLDHFKEYNDAHGHQAGNVILQRVAQQIRASCRDSDLVFRFGGDEFAVLLPNTGLTGARTVAAKVNGAIAEIAGGNESVGLTCSVGVAAFPRDAHDAASVILAADRACYAAKRSGRNRIATAAQGRALASDFQPTEPTRVEQQQAFSAA